METGYLASILNGMASMFDAITSPSDRQLIMVASLTRFLNCDSLLDLADTYEINKDSLYQALDVVTPPRWLRRIMKAGRQRLTRHLRRWRAGDPSFRSRHSITLCADDFTRTTRGDVGGWSGIFYSGAEGGVVTGLNIEVLCAVIGDGLEVIILDVRIVPPKPVGSGARPLSQNQWLRRALRNLNCFLTTQGIDLKGTTLAIDAAYVSKENVALAKDLGIHMVSKLSANRKVTGNADGLFTGLVGQYAGLSLFLNHRNWRPLRGEDGVEYQRNIAIVPSLDSQVLLVTFIRERDFAVYFSTNVNMKTITLRNITRYRWQLERIFWILKQDIGIGDIHHHKETRVEARIYLHVILAQVTRDTAAIFRCSPKDIVRSIRRTPDLVLHQLGFPSAFATALSPETVPQVRHAA